jgi:DNA-binding transcriptional LysR family regulator
MTLDQLRIFVAVARREHVSQAARELHLTQSAVSGALQALETRYGVRLFDRIGRGVKLNPAGRAFLADAEAVVARAHAAEAALEDLSDLRRGRLAIRAAPTIANYWLPRRLGAFRAIYPGVELALEIGDTASVIRAVAEGEAELGFAGVAPSGPSLATTIVGRDQLVLLAPAQHPWGYRSCLTAKDLQAETWIMREQGSGTRESLDAGLQAAGASPEGLRISLTLPSNEAVMNAVEAGGGVSALSEHIALPALETGRLVRGPLPLPVRPFFLLRRKVGYLTRAAAAFVDRLTDPPED